VRSADLVRPRGATLRRQRGRVWLALALALLGGGCASTSATHDSATADLTAAAGRQVVLTVRQPEAFSLGLTGTPSQRYLQRRYGPTPSVERILTQLAREHELERVDGWPIESLQVYCEVFAVPGDRPLADVIAALDADPRVELVQPMHLFDTQTTRYDDPYVELQSAAVQMDIEEAHQIATGRGVSIAIIDSAVDASHPDLRGRVRLTRDLVNERQHPRDGEVHGTAVAGIIASAANNREGIVGVAPDVSIASLRACWSVTPESIAAQCSTFSLARALEMALNLKPNVVNLSLSGPDDPLLSSLLDEVIARGIVVVAAQPEHGDTIHIFPASHPKVLSAHSSLDASAAPSRYALGAPAIEVLTTTPGARYAFLTGNSLAAAHASGVVALLMEREPLLDVDRIAALLIDTTIYSPGSASINACRALERLSGGASCPRSTELARF
jgi:subtilisin family serine protease